MTEEHIIDAIRQVKSHCDLLMETYKMVSMRSALTTLGFTVEETNEIIEYCSDHGFSYCIDYIVPVKNFDQPDLDEYPSQKVCYWGPDQLKSRLEFVR